MGEREWKTRNKGPQSGIEPGLLQRVRTQQSDIVHFVVARYLLPICCYYTTKICHCLLQLPMTNNS